MAARGSAKCARDANRDRSEMDTEIEIHGDFIRKE
jgi:hypothetical protein